MAEGNGSAATQQPNGRLPGASPISGVPPPIEHRWKPGQSGNPKGPTPTITKALRRVLREERDEKGRSVRAYQLARAQVDRAIAGDTTAARYVTETLQGKPEQSVKHAGAVQFNIQGSS